ncbi:MAG: hypothetical protein AAF449_07890 [Myxococcota bacterium]
MHIEDRAWILAPEEAWPAGTVLQVAPDLPVVDADGRPVVWPVDALYFEVAPLPPVERITVRWPTPGLPASSGLRWFALQGVSPSRQQLVLRSDDHEVVAERKETIAGVTRFKILNTPCGGLCPQTSYAVLIDGESTPGVRGQVSTSTRVDALAPSFEMLEVDVWPGELEIRWASIEPVRVLGRLLGPNIDTETTIGLGRAGRWRWPAMLLAGADYTLTLTALDMLDQQSTSVERSLVGPTAVQVRLTEIVSTPRSDWGDSEPRGRPFDSSPGRGTVSSADEWVELVNHSEQPIDIEAVGLRLRTIDGTPAETPVALAPALSFGDGGRISAWRPGEALVVRQRGEMSRSPLVIEVWAGALLLDRVVLGDGADADHPGGSPPDLAREAVAHDATGRWRWCRPTPGDPGPNLHCEPE